MVGNEIFFHYQQKDTLLKSNVDTKNICWMGFGKCISFQTLGYFWGISRSMLNLRGYNTELPFQAKFCAGTIVNDHQSSSKRIIRIRFCVSVEIWAGVL